MTDTAQLNKKKINRGAVTALCRPFFKKRRAKMEKTWIEKAAEIVPSPRQVAWNCMEFYGFDTLWAV